MTVDEAKTRAKQLNAQGHLERAKAKAFARLSREEKVVSAFLPSALTDPFLVYLKQEIDIGPTGPKKWKKVLCHWEYVKRMVAAIERPPSQWEESKRRFYDYMAKQETSLEYVGKILRILNMWGVFQARKTGQSFIPVPSPKGYDRELIAEAFADSDKKKKTSLPITPEQLEAARGRLSAEQYRWLYLSVWLGLRPPEVDSLATARLSREQGVPVVWVYQSKLRGVRKEDRYKPIPILYPEQRKCLEMMKEPVKRPLVKTVQKHVLAGANLYGGRKGFTDLMLSRGQTLEDISTWLGHATIERTWASYKQRQKVSFRKVS